jgi:hypothetical protein
LLDLTETDDGVLIPVKVVPSASRDRIAGVLDGALKITVAAPPEKGKANKAVIALLARALGVKKHQLAVVVGATSPHKTVAARGVEAGAVRLLVKE